MQRDSGAPFYEFFAGGGLARLGLGPHFACIFANDINPAKLAAYRAAHGDAGLRGGDIWDLSAADLPGRAGLAWASFPCQDLSLAGARGGLSAPRSGAFWGFHRLIAGLAGECRAPRVLALENVTGLLSSHGGADFAALVRALSELGYQVGALEIDAALFTPHSRPRLFIVAAREAHCAQGEPSLPFHTPALVQSVARLPEDVRTRFIWWRLPTPRLRNTNLIDLLESDGEVSWHEKAETAHLLALMSPLQRARVEAKQKAGGLHVGALFRRVRTENGKRVQRAEARFDGLAGCLRTPAGGSSRQVLLFIEGGEIRSRLLSAREAARLMGAPEDYPLPVRLNEALHLFGDGVSIPVVRWLAENLLAPLAGLSSQENISAIAP